MYAADGNDRKSNDAHNQARTVAAQLKAHFADSDYSWRAGAWCTNWMRAFLFMALIWSEHAWPPSHPDSLGLHVRQQPGGFLSPISQSVLLGIVEGLTEFLPVSSTAHLRIAEALMKIPLDDPYWMMYTIVIQVGAIFALCLLFLERIVNFMRTFPEGENGDRNWLTIPSLSR